MVYMFLADGFEETEALVTLDMMRRAGIAVKTVGIGTDLPRGSHGISVATDITEASFTFNDCEGVVLPGGMPGTENLYLSDTVLKAVEYCYSNNLLIAAICAAPIILGRKGYLCGKKAVCYPGFEKELKDADVIDGYCVTDGNVITAKGAGCVFEFSYVIISYLVTTAAAEKVIAEVQHKGLK